MCGEVAGTISVNFGAVEDGGGVAEDEVDAAFDVGVEVVLAAVVGEEGVLVAEEAAVLEDGAVGADGGGDGPAGVAGGVLEGDVVGLERGAVDLDGFGEEGSAGLFGVKAVGDDGVFGALAGADEGEVGVVLGDDDALVIGAGGDLYIDAGGFSVFAEGVGGARGGGRARSGRWGRRCDLRCRDRRAVRRDRRGRGCPERRRRWRLVGEAAGPIAWWEG